MTREGVVLRVRPISAADRDALRDAFEKLSPESRYRRFLAPVQYLSAARSVLSPAVLPGAREPRNASAHPLRSQAA